MLEGTPRQAGKSSQVLQAIQDVLTANNTPVSCGSGNMPSSTISRQRARGRRSPLGRVCRVDGGSTGKIASCRKTGTNYSLETPADVKKGYGGSSKTRSSRAGEDLVENLNSALRALGSTPSRVMVSDVASPIPMRSLDANEMNPSPISMNERDGRRIVDVNEKSIDGERFVKLQRKHRELVDECTEMEARMLKTQQTEEKLYSTMMKYSNELEDMRKERSDFEAELQKLGEEKKLKQLDVDDLERARDAKLSALQEELSMLQEKKNMLSSEMEKLNEEMNSSRLVKQQLEGEIREKRQEIQHAEETLAKRKEEVHNLEIKYQNTHKELIDAEERKREAEKEASMAVLSAQRSAEAMAAAESLVEEGHRLAEEHSSRASVAQKEWEEAEKRLGDVQCALIEASARLEAKRTMLLSGVESLSGSMASRHDHAVETVKQSIQQQENLLYQLVQTNEEKLKEYKALCKKIEDKSFEYSSLSESRCTQDNLIKDIEEENARIVKQLRVEQAVAEDANRKRKDAEAALEESLKEIDRYA